LGAVYYRVNTANGVVEFDDVKVWPRPITYTPLTSDPIYVDNIQTARVSLANETAGQLSNTGMTIVSGTWAITESASGRAITCVVAGQLRGSAQGASAATTKLFTQTGGVVLTKNAADFTLDATAGDTVTALQLTAP
jgi:hypothetical protein